MIEDITDTTNKKKGTTDIGRHRHVIFGCDDLNLKVRCKMTGPATLISHHHEGWQQVQRLMNMSFPEWQGAPGWEIGIPCVFDELHDEISIEKRLYTLVRMQLPSPKYSPLRPPQIWFDSQGDVPHDRTRWPRQRWLIAGTGLEWGDYTTIRRHHHVHHGHHHHHGGPKFFRVRQFVTVHLWEFFSEKIDIAQLHNLQYKIRKGDTIRSIASRYYGSPNAWPKVLAANKKIIKDPNHLPVGKTIKLP